MRRRPFVPKDYRHPLAHQTRVAWMMVATGLERLVHASVGRTLNIPVPDLAQLGGTVPVVKTVGNQLEIQKFADADPALTALRIVGGGDDTTQRTAEVLAQSLLVADANSRDRRPA